MLIVSALLAVNENTKPYAYILVNISDETMKVYVEEHSILDDVEAWNGCFVGGVFLPVGCRIDDVPVVHRVEGVLVKHAGKYAWCIGILEDTRVRLVSVYGKVVDVEYVVAMRLAAAEGICNVTTDNLQLYGNVTIPKIKNISQIWTGAFTREPKVGDVITKDIFDVFGDPLGRAGDILTRLQVCRLRDFCILPPILDTAGLRKADVRLFAEYSTRWYVDLGEASWLLHTVAEGREVTLDMLRKGLPTKPLGGVAWVFRLSELDSTVVGHSLTVAQLVGCIAKDVLRGRSAVTVEQAILGALLHDVGKLKVNQNILEAGRRLTSEEFHEIEKHPQIGYDLLTQSSSEEVRRVALVALRHHVKKNGKGYPKNIDMSSLRMLDLVVQFCDILSALLAKRQYKEPIPPMQALRIVCEEFSENVHPKVGNLCADAIQKSLVGATVQMVDGSYGVIKSIKNKNKNPVGTTLVVLQGTGEQILSDGCLESEPMRIIWR